MLRIKKLIILLSLLLLSQSAYADRSERDDLLQAQPKYRLECGIRTNPEDTSDEDHNLSEQDILVRRAFLNSAGRAVRAHAEGLVEAILDRKATVEGYITLIANIPELPGIIAEYADELIHEEDEEKRAEMLGNLLMEAILAVSPSPLCVAVCQECEVE
jgi:hypothetical protein